MGYFSILKVDAGDSPQVMRAHINLWSLPSLIPGRRLFYFDVGVEVRAGADPVTSLEMMLPFRVEEGLWPDDSKVAQDLFESLASPDTAELIFGGPVGHRTDGGHHYLRIGDYPAELRLTRIDVSSVKRVETYQSRADSSLYRFDLASSISPGEQAYFRLRWRVFGAHPLWRWKRISGGARMDLRISDVRESRYASVDRSLRDKILEIQEVNVFLMASPKLQLVAHSPEFRYLRILEPGAWKTYLKGAQHFGGVRGLLVYYWRYPQKPPAGPNGTAAKRVNMDNPYRVFLDFNRTASATWWVQIVRVMIGVALALAVLKGLDSSRPWEWDYSNLSWKRILALLGVTSLLAIVSLVEKMRTAVADRFLWPRGVLRRLERKLLRGG